MIGFGNVAFKIGDDNRIQKFSHISVLEQLGIKVTAIIDRQPSPQALLYAKEKNIPIFHNYQSLLENCGSYFDLGVFCLPTTIDLVVSFLSFLNTFYFSFNNHCNTTQIFCPFFSINLSISCNN